MKSWRKRNARSAEQIEAKAAGSHGNGAESEDTGKPQSGKPQEATGSHRCGAEIEDTGKPQTAKPREAM